MSWKFRQVTRRGLSALLLASSLTGCASLTASRTERVHIVTEPEGAEVRLNGRRLGSTPLAVDVDRVRIPNIQFQITKDGYQPQQCRLQSRIGVGYLVADTILCVLFMPVGCIAFIDATGAWNEVVSDDCTVTLEPMGPGGPVAMPPIL